MIVENDRIVAMGKHLSPEAAYGEFIGLAKFSAKGAEILKANYHDVLEKFDGRPFQKAPILRKAYPIDMIQELIDRGYEIHKVDIVGDWVEIDIKSLS